MADAIQILPLEDSLADRELVRELLAERCMGCQITPVCTRQEFSSYLLDRKWDLILTDFALPGFDGASALSMARQLCPRTPFIFLSGVMGEDLGVESLKCGATDYVRKQGMKRLCPAIQRAIKESEVEVQLAAARARALYSDLFSALGMTAGNIAHEINNPLAIIHPSASDLIESATDATISQDGIARAASRIKNTANRITKIVKSLRQISRDGSADPFQRASVSVIIDQTLELCKERFRAHSVSLDIPVVDPNLHVLYREVQIAQVLLNLLQNAFDAVVDLPSNKWVRISVIPQPASVVFSVIDSGPGVPPDLQQRIMVPFFTTKPVGRGTGLGLSLSKAIVEEHGGQLQLSQSDQHTCFSFSVPLFMEAQDATQQSYGAARG